MDEWRSLIDAAERAAAGGDHQVAEERLREAARLQEASLGTKHPELANTLNNLGVVSELLGKTGDAEQYFRRAAAMAAACLPADDPLVATSRKNLEDFCAARGIAVGDVPKPAAVEPPAPPPQAPVMPPRATPPRTTPPRTASPASPAAGPMTARPSRPAPPTVAAPTEAPARRLSGATIAILLVVAAILVYLMAFRGSGQEEPPQQGTPTTSVPAVPDPVPPAPAPREPPPAAAPATKAGGGSQPPVPPGGGADAGGVRVPGASPPTAPLGKGGDAIAVVDARLCRSITTSGVAWDCTPPERPVEAGRLTFYTRVRTPRDTSIVHRWYRENSLEQEVELNVSANTGPGYRTYSRHVVTPGAAEWRLEISTTDGTVLHEERFVAR
jgi:hypothetical protein